MTPTFLPVPKVRGKANPVNYSVGFINSANEGAACMVRGERARPSALGRCTWGVPELLSPFQGGQRCQGKKRAIGETIKPDKTAPGAATGSLEHGMEPASGAAVGLCPWQGYVPGCVVPCAVPTRVLGCGVNTHRSWGVISSYTGPGV